MLVWSAVGTATAVTTTCDLLSIIPAAGKPVIVLSARVAQKTKAQDANDAMQRIGIVTGNTTVGSGGGAYTPKPVGSPGASPTASSTVRIFDSTIASAGTAITLVEDDFDVRAGWLYIPTPDEREEVA